MEANRRKGVKGDETAKSLNPDALSKNRRIRAESLGGFEESHLLRQQITETPSGLSITSDVIYR